MGKDERYNLEGVNNDLGADRDSPTETAAGAEREDESETTPTASTTTGADTKTGGSDNTTDDAPASTTDRADIPHRVRYDSPKEGRKAKTFYLDEERDLARLRELHSLAETEFSEKVHQLDVYLAAFRSDLSDESFLKEMRRMGYGYFE